MTRLGIGVIGCGSIAELAHFPSIAKFPDLELVAICDPNPNLVSRTANKWHPRTTFADYRSMIDAGDLDVVIVASPNRYHFEHASAAIAAGLHVYVEKPMCCTNLEAWTLVKAAKERGVTLTVGCNQRFWLQHEWAKQLIEDGVVGEVKLVRSSLHETWHLYQDNVALSDYRVRASEAVSGTLFDQGSHRADLAMWLMGSRPKRVVGVACNVADPTMDGPMDDLAIAMVEATNGAFGIVTSDKFSPVVSNLTEVYGTEGMLFASSEAINPFQTVPLAVYTARDYVWESLPDLLRKYRYPSAFWVTDLVTRPLEKKWISIVPPREWSFTRMMDDFLTAILEGRAPRVTAEDGAWTMEVLCGVFKSMSTGGWVDLPMREEVVPPFYRRSVGGSA